jgi:glutathione S-transferase
VWLQSPVITDHGKVIAESSTIIGTPSSIPHSPPLNPHSLIDYVTHTYGPTPATREFNLANSYWSAYSEGSLMLFLQMTLVLSVAAQQAPWMARTVINKFVDGVKVSFPSSLLWGRGKGADVGG